MGELVIIGICILVIGIRFRPIQGGGFRIGESGTSFSLIYYVEKYLLLEEPIEQIKRRKGLVTPTSTTVKRYEADESFSDRGLDQLIADGRYTKARGYATDMIALAHKMDDREFEANYRAYSKKILEARQNSKRGSEQMVS